MITFREMKEQYDKYNCFQDYVTIEHAKNIQLIPDSLARYIPNKCECGSENIITFNLKSAMCCDPKCPIKIPLRLHSLFTRFSCTGIGEATCIAAYNQIQKFNKWLLDNGKESILKTNSYVEILNLKRSEFPFEFSMSAAGSNFIDYCEYIRNKNLTFAEMIGKLGIPAIESNDQKLFRGINTFEQLRQAILADGSVANFCENRGVHDKSVWFWLFNSLEDIFVAYQIFCKNVRIPGLTEMKLCITGRLSKVGYSITKSNYALLCNKYSMTKKPTEILIEILKENEKEVDITVIKSLLEKWGFTCDLEDRQYTNIELCDILAEYEKSDSSIQLLEHKVTAAKNTAPYIIADYESTTDKYRTGLARGEEMGVDGKMHKVLIDSVQYLDLVKEMVNTWNSQMKQEILQLIYPESQMTCLNPQAKEMTLF